MSAQSPAAIPQPQDVPISTPLGTFREPTKDRQKLALLGLSHTALEHRIYRAMYGETVLLKETVRPFGVRRLLVLTGMRSHGSIRRGCAGLIEKLSIESLDNGNALPRVLFRVFSPGEIFERRRNAGIGPYPTEVSEFKHHKAFSLAIEHVIGRDDLSRREALVILCCVEGLSNAEIGVRLQISEQTVKSHLRYIFDKFSVRRRTELVSHLLTEKFKANGRRY